jgi:hypothetical protein
MAHVAFTSVIVAGIAFIQRSALCAFSPSLFPISDPLNQNATVLFSPHFWLLAQQVWAVRYGMKGAEAASKSGGLLGAPHEPPKSRTQLWAALNRDQGLLKEVLSTLCMKFDRFPVELVVSSLYEKHIYRGIHRLTISVDKFDVSSFLLFSF